VQPIVKYIFESYYKIFIKCSIADELILAADATILHCY